MSWLQPSRLVSDVGDYVKRQFGDESGVQITDADILRWINAAQAEIATANNVLKSSAELVLTTGMYRYPLGDSMRLESVNSVHINGAKVDFMQFVEYELYLTNEDPSHIAVGRPDIWTEWGGSFILYPTPDQDYTMEVYFYAVPGLVNDPTDTLTIPDKYFQRVLDYVLAQAYELDENFQASDAKMSSYANSLIGMAEMESKGAVDSYPIITIRPEDM